MARRTASAVLAALVSSKRIASAPALVLALALALAACATHVPVPPQPPPQGQPPAPPQGQSPPPQGQPPAPPRQAAGEKTDDWEYSRQLLEERGVRGGGVGGGVVGGVVGGISGAMPAAPPPPPAPAMRTAALGLSAGGAKDAGNFRENVRAGYLPLPTDIQYEGLFYDYYFDTGAGSAEPCRQLFCPSYVGALSPDPFSRRHELFLSVGLNSGIDAGRFSRKRLNLVVVLDISGSMGAPFDEYYYDRFGNRQEAERADARRTKLEIATRSVVSLLSHLTDDDRLGVVLFDDRAYRAKRLRELGLSDRERLRGHILDIQPGSSTNMEAGLSMAIEMLEPFAESDREQYENRIVFLTDAMPNTGRTGEEDLLSLARGAAARRLHATFVGVGVDFNTELVAGISRIRGANYYSVHSAREFARRLDEEFEFMVTPLVFDLQLRLETSGYEIVKVYGSPEANEATGEIMKVNTLFPSKVEDGQTRGGVVLLELRQTRPGGRLALTASYEDRAGRRESETKVVSVPALEAPRPALTTGIRKAILLSRYADLLKAWAADEAASRVEKRPIVVSVNETDGIPCPRGPLLGRWERQSLPLRVSAEYRPVLAKFLEHFRAEASTLGDATLDKEAKLLEFLLSR